MNIGEASSFDAGLEVLLGVKLSAAFCCAAHEDFTPISGDRVRWYRTVVATEAKSTSVFEVVSLKGSESPSNLRNAGFELLNPTAGSKVVVSLLINESPLLIRESAHHISEMDKTKVPILLELSRLQDIINLKLAIWRNPIVWHRS